jgi:hypothetical protein
MVVPLHAPAPSHVPSVVSTPFAQLAVVHTVPAAYFEHAPVPAAHWPSVPQLAAPWSGQDPEQQ